MNELKIAYNQCLHKLTVPKEYEKLCNLCNGVGIYEIIGTCKGRCPMCNGEGKIDWIDEIKGLPSKRMIYFERRCGPFY